MTAAGQNGVHLEIVPSRVEFAKEHAKETVIPPCHLKKAYHVLDPNQSQKTVTKKCAVVGTLDISNIKWQILLFICMSNIGVKIQLR